MKSKLSQILLLLVMPLALFAAGQQEASETGDPGLKKISAIFDRILTEDNGQKEWAAAFEDLTGTKIEIVKPVHNQYSQILGATFAAGDLPDIVEIQTNDYLSYAKSGHLVPLEEYIEKSAEFKNVSKDLIEAYRLKDGHIYGVPTYDGGGCVTYIRKDWLDNLNMKVPTTWDEYYNVLKAFTFSDPDGNGVNDTMGLTMPFQTGYEFDYYNRFIMQQAMFGFQNKNGKWVDGFLEPEMKDALTRFNKLYNEGILDNEFFTNKTSTARSKIYEGQAGVMEYWSGTWAERFDESAKNSNPAAQVISIEPIKNAFYINRVGPAFSITTAAKNPAAVFDVFLNTMLDKGAGQVLFTYGIEGTHYEMKDGKYVMMPEPANPDRPFDKAYSDPTLIMNNWKPLVPLTDLINLSREIHVANSIQLSLPQGGDIYIKRNGELLTVKQEFFALAVTGALTPAEAQAQYKAKAMDLELDTILAELNQ
ncbi:extracellular solute-binding protein [Oceanispirochaeta sp.]|jgi:putative aldouronate transport system substrate-binding protein|uniref:extracellular solute-binding protein n=1 Tax=Oceanispirochaeta sp. TaxID=2035350 RepID=UPI0026389B31|nr:extracellular solute-binding protein [Oceanispirochaeta sp.]MDA3955510.1 extracellular solute-binding protein [Oceanispirochaeta sp.]